MNSTERPIWKCLPGLLGLILAPLLFGSVNPEGQAVVGLLFGSSLFLMADELGEGSVRVLKPFWIWVILLLLVLPLLPWPIWVISKIHPERAALAQAFPLEIGSASSWIPFTVSPANTIQRLWELALVLAAFVWARQSAGHPAFGRWFALGIGAAVLLLAASDFWFRHDGQRSVFGLWQSSWGQGAGTFANKNHFAGWIYVGALFAWGWLMRNVQPLQGSRQNFLRRENLHRLDAIFLLGALGAGIYFAIATGSRGGFLAAIAGGTVWLALLMSRSRSRSRWFMLGLSAVAVVALLLPAADFLLRRIAETPANAATTGKLQIWTYSLQLFSRFPILGVGPGGFATAFNHFKPSGGSTTVWHAENEYIQWIVEMGAVGGLVALVLFWHGIRVAWPMAFQQRFDEPELIFGALAALGAFAVHALVEFVFQIPSTAVLAAALLGFLLGARDSGLRPAVPQALPRSRMIFNYAVTFAFLIIALLQGLAFWAWHRAKSEPIPAARIALAQRSLQLWPWAVSRQIGLTRLRVQHLNALPRSEASRLAQRTRSELQSALARDPYHWELRLERAWFDLAFGNDQNRAVAEAREVMRLNPLQVQIPLRFARHFRDENPVLAWEFLSKAPVEPGMTLRETLFLAWDLTKDASKLWDLTPNSPGALKTLGEVALELKLYPLAVQAYDSVRDQFEPEMLAEIYLRAQRPDLALSVLEEAGMGFRVRRLRAEALRQSGKIAAAMRVAESLCLDSAARGQLLGSIKTSETLERLRASWTAKPDDVPIARQLAEKICEAPPSARDVALLQALAAKHPAELRLTWLLYQTQRDINRLPEAAQTLMQLAIRIERLEG